MTEEIAYLFIVCVVLSIMCYTVNTWDKQETFVTFATDSIFTFVFIAGAIWIYFNP